MRPPSQATVSCESGAGNARHAKVRASDPPPSRNHAMVHARGQKPRAFFFPALGGGESGIRTHDALIAHTRSPGVRLRPLGHLSAVAAFYLRKKKARRAG